MDNLLFLVPEFCEGLRLDIFISSRIKKISRSKVRFLILNGKISVNSLVKKPSYRVMKGELISIFIENESNIDHNIACTKFSLKIIYEDSEMVVVNKGCGVVVHPSPGHLSDTLINMVLDINPNLKNIFLNTYRPGLIHRLDKDTSGLLIFAKNLNSFKKLLFQFKKRLVFKQYVSLVYGIPDTCKGVINFSIGRHPFNRKRMSIYARNSKKALTYWVLREKYENIAALLEVNIRTGRTHQIRVHLQAINHSILGDLIYGNKNLFMGINKEFKNINFRVERQMLHANKIYFKHPTTESVMTFELILPKDMKKIINELRS